MDLTLIIFLVLANSDVRTSPIGFIGWPQDAINTGTGSIWHVFRQVHASEVASRQFLSSSRTPSAKVAETTKIIPKEERSRSYEPSFTIISRIKSPMEQMLALIPARPSWTPGFLGRRTEAISTRKEESSSRTSSLNGLAPWSSHNASNLLIIGEAEPVVDDQRHVETSRKSAGLFTVEKGMVRYRGSQRGEDLNGNGHYPPESPSTFGLWEMLKLRRPQKWEALNKLLPSQSTTEREPAIEPTTTSTTPFSWNTEQAKNESHHWLENVDSLTLTEINSRTEEASTILPTTIASITDSQEQPDATTDRNASSSEDSGSIPTTRPSPIASHQLNSSGLVVRIDESIYYAVTDSFTDNGTIVFKRFQTNGANQSGWSDLSDIEVYYPGFGQVAINKPAQLIVFTTIVANVDEIRSQQQEYATTQPAQTGTMGERPTVPIVTSTLSPVETETIAFDTNRNVTVADNEEDVKQGAANIVAHQLQSLSPVFRKVDDDKSAVNSVEPNLDNEAADVAMNFAVSALVNNVTDVPTSSTEEQMTPPLLKTLENLLLTHLLPPISSSSSISSSVASSPAIFNVTSPSTPSSTTVRTVYHFTSASPSTSTSSSTTSTASTSATTSTSTESYFSWLLHHAASAEPIRSINDWSFASQLIEPARMSPTDPASHSTTVVPEEIIQAPVHYDPAINAGTLSSHSMIIPARSSSIVQSLPSRKPISERIVTTDQFSLNAVTDKRPVSQTIASPIQMFTLKPEVEASKIVTNKPVSKKNSGLASLILAHTSALMSGKNSPFSNGNRRPSNSSDNRQTKRNSLPEPAPVTASVHVIVASPFPDAEQEEQLRQRSLDSRVRNNNKNAIKTGNSSWAFPSFSQLIESPELLLSNVASSNASIIRAVNSAPISSFNGNTNDDLPSLPRFSCGGQSSSDELVLTNPNYPNPDDDAGNCGFRLLVNSNHVCQVRVEFRDGRMLLPRKGNCVHQYLTVSQSTSGRVPSVVENKFCGFNTDQHFYVELAESGTNSRHVDFKVNTKAAGFPYRYSMIVNQINCDLPSPDKAPTGCFQYFNSRSGVIKSFNFEGGQYWNNQNYRICIRSISDSCTLSLSSTEGDFGIQKAISRRVPAKRAGVGIKACPRDYLLIPGTVQSEEKSQSGESNDRYCGSKFSDRPGDFRHRIVLARMQNDVHMMTFRAGVPQHYNASHHGPGFRIDFEQINECRDLPINLNMKINGTESATLEEDDDYYDEEATVKDVVRSKMSFE
ncbi:uncharacterized protein LOC130688187 isoform X2 [Daphnia carinata]|uniref:uncharacterized protein LOC130688187 isoform X2 n=1 Tax=Daphnia carinata TaxID=120202 RepID=UPI00257A3584|nr:uncharacterized protein LOC130688187 isoform X2 [Daphnia carinata]